MSENKTQFWICIIGPAKEKSLKPGADSPMRHAVEKAFLETTGHEDEDCWSGWGATQERADIINCVWSLDESDPLYEQIKTILKERIHGINSIHS